MEDLEALLEGDPRVVKAVQAEIGRHRLCDDCLGRQLGKVDHGTNLERGRIMRETVEPRSEPVRPENCHLCEGLVDEYDDLAAEVQHALEDYEWNTFLVGTKAPKRVTQLEVDLLRLFPSVWIESFKAEVNREVGRRVEAATGKEAEFETPDMTVLVDPEFNTTEVQVRSVYVYGRYRKLARGIPQTRWPCRKCKGRGCEACDGTGQQYETSVEQLIASPFMEALEGKEHAFHGPSTKAEVVTLKEANWEKTYLISFDVEGGATNEELAGIAGTLSGTVVRQRTPQRVAHRRADKERPRMVKHLALVDLDGATAKVEVRGESGIYVKELIHGDRGRTQPSMAELLGRPCSVVELDVLQVHDADDDRGE
jgi:tRNA pseudouridine synthase 10